MNNNKILKALKISFKNRETKKTMQNLLYLKDSIIDGVRVGLHLIFQSI